MINRPLKPNEKRRLIVKLLERLEMYGGAPGCLARQGLLLIRGHEIDIKTFYRIIDFQLDPDESERVGLKP